MNNETKIGLVKEWDSPRSNVQLFMPQEYIAACDYQSVTLTPNWGLTQRHYIDLNGNNTYQHAGEYFKVDGSSGRLLGIDDGLSNGKVTIYRLQKQTLGQSSWNDSDFALTSAEADKSYLNTFKVGGDNYRFVANGTYQIKIEDNHAYFLSGENLS